LTQAVFKKEFKLHFPGDATAYDPDDVYGPNTMGELFRPAWAFYDAAADRTTIHFDVARTTDLPALAEKKIAKIEEAGRIQRLFGGGR
jgi:hypothetical protein